MKKLYVLLTTILFTCYGAQAQLETNDDLITSRGGLIFFTLNASAGGDSYNTDVYFNPNASLAFNFGFDAELFSIPSFVLYTELIEINSGSDPTMLSLQAINTTDLANTTIPIGIISEQGEQITFTLTANTLPSTTELWLDDTVEDTSTLLNSGDYVITPSVDLNGTGRFYLRVYDDTLLSTTEDNLETLTVFALNQSKEIVVKGQLLNNTTLNLYDVLGKHVLSTQLDDSTQDNRIDVSAISSGIYVVNIENNGQSKSQKVIIK
ncbi:T9SS type A sorting domain-containing protein [Psychroserpens sp. S379A]|uniref:T9SS type A sorting domain-containing protein n=1 Tax=Psychroserpens sp. S379A TaxID=3415137 RepID=UPI003C79769E